MKRRGIASSRLIYLFQGSVIPQPRAAAIPNATFVTNFDGTYHRRSFCSNNEVDKGVIKGSKEFSHPPAEANWENYTRRCTDIVSDFLRAIGTLIGPKEQKNGMLNFKIHANVVHTDGQCSLLEPSKINTCNGGTTIPVVTSNQHENNILVPKYPSSLGVPSPDQMTDLLVTPEQSILPPKPNSQSGPSDIVLSYQDGMGFHAPQSPHPSMDYNNTPLVSKPLASLQPPLVDYRPPVEELTQPFTSQPSVPVIASSNQFLANLPTSLPEHITSDLTLQQPTPYTQVNSQLNYSSVQETDSIVSTLPQDTSNMPQPNSGSASENLLTPQLQSTEPVSNSFFNNYKSLSPPPIVDSNTAIAKPDSLGQYGHHTLESAQSSLLLTPGPVTRSPGVPEFAPTTEFQSTPNNYPAVAPLPMGVDSNLAGTTSVSETLTPYSPNSVEPRPVLDSPYTSGASMPNEPQPQLELINPDYQPMPNNYMTAAPIDVDSSKLVPSSLEAVQPPSSFVPQPTGKSIPPSLFAYNSLPSTSLESQLESIQPVHRPTLNDYATTSYSLNSDADKVAPNHLVNSLQKHSDQMLEPRQPIIEPELLLQSPTVQDSTPITIPQPQLQSSELVDQPILNNNLTIFSPPLIVNFKAPPLSHSEAPLNEHLNSNLESAQLVPAFIPSPLAEPPNFDYGKLPFQPEVTPSTFLPPLKLDGTGPQDNVSRDLMQQEFKDQSSDQVPTCNEENSKLEDANVCKFSNDSFIRPSAASEPQEYFSQDFSSQKQEISFPLQENTQRQPDFTPPQSEFSASSSGFPQQSSEMILPRPLLPSAPDFPQPQEAVPLLHTGLPDASLATSQPQNEFTPVQPSLLSTSTDYGQIKSDFISPQPVLNTASLENSQEPADFNTYSTHSKELPQSQPNINTASLRLSQQTPEFNPSQSPITPSFSDVSRQPSDFTLPQPEVNAVSSGLPLQPSEFMASAPVFSPSPDFSSSQPDFNSPKPSLLGDSKRFSPSEPQFFTPQTEFNPASSEFVQQPNLMPPQLPFSSPPSSDIGQAQPVFTPPQPQITGTSFDLINQQSEQTDSSSPSPAASDFIQPQLNNFTSQPPTSSASGFPQQSSNFQVTNPVMNSGSSEFIQQPFNFPTSQPSFNSPSLSFPQSQPDFATPQTDVNASSESSQQSSEFNSLQPPIFTPSFSESSQPSSDLAPPNLEFNAPPSGFPQQASEKPELVLSPHFSQPQDAPPLPKLGYSSAPLNGPQLQSDFSPLQAPFLSTPSDFRQTKSDFSSSQPSFNTDSLEFPSLQPGFTTSPSSLTPTSSDFSQPPPQFPPSQPSFTPVSLDDSQPQTGISSSQLAFNSASPELVQEPLPISNATDFSRPQPDFTAQQPVFNAASTDLNNPESDFAPLQPPLNGMPSQFTEEIPISTTLPLPLTTASEGFSQPQTDFTASQPEFRTDSLGLLEQQPEFISSSSFTSASSDVNQPQSELTSPQQTLNSVSLEHSEKLPQFNAPSSTFASSPDFSPTQASQFTPQQPALNAGSPQLPPHFTTKTAMEGVISEFTEQPLNFIIPGPAINAETELLKPQTDFNSPKSDLTGTSLGFSPIQPDFGKYTPPTSSVIPDFSQQKSELITTQTPLHGESSELTPQLPLI